MQRTTPLIILLAFAMPVALTSCGGGDGQDVFRTCPDGVLDPGEECDDGNNSDNDDCLTTCVFNVCNDQFINIGVEPCDGLNLGGNTCEGLGFGPGELMCTESCELDTTNCGPPLGSTPTPATTPTGPVPTATPTPSGPTCNGSELIRVEVDIDSGGVSLAGVTVRIDYPTNQVEIPGSTNDASVQDRVEFLVPAAFRSVNDQDTNDDGTDDRLNLSATGVTPFSPGEFADVDFDCLAGAPAPTVGDFVCSAVGSDEFGGELTTDCLLTLP